MDNIFSGFSQTPSGPMPSAPPFSISAPSSSFGSVAPAIQAINSFGQPNDVSGKLKITSWLLFVVSIIFSIVFA